MSINDKNSFERSELRVLFNQYGVTPTNELLDVLAQMVGGRQRQAEKACQLVREFEGRFGNNDDIEELEVQDIQGLSSQVYSLVWQTPFEQW